MFKAIKWLRLSLAQRRVIRAAKAWEAGAQSYDAWVGIELELQEAVRQLRKAEDRQ